MRDNATIAGEKDLVRDHDLLKQSHTRGLFDPDNRAEDEFTAALFVSETVPDHGRPVSRQRLNHDAERKPTCSESS